MYTELIEELRATFEYHEDGYLIRRSTGKPCGQRANTRQGYAYIGVNGRMLLAHRVIYALVHGTMPEDGIDHIDQDPMNNRIENLRAASQSVNMHNRKMNKGSSSGFTGVDWYAPLQKWRARICVNNRQIYLGVFEDFEDAVNARKMAKIKHHPSSPEAVKYVSEQIMY